VVKDCLLFLIAAFGLGLALCATAQAQDAKQGLPLKAKNAPLKVMSFNLRFASPNPPHSWPQRRPVMSESLRVSSPDLIGTQEGVYYQLRDIADDRPEYDWIGIGRDGGSRGEFMAVFYRKERLEPLEFDHFWLSDTPHVVGSTTWGNTNIRMVTWVRFRDKLTDQEFYFWNTHLDHQVQIAREKAAALILERANALKTTLPILLVGDFNAAARANKAYDILLEGGFTDTWFSAAQRGTDVATFHGYKPPTPNGPHIDWILSRGAVTAHQSEVITFEKDGQQPSDHFPVMATLSFSGTIAQ
jgi:endonuclease/exonuclease/phosphatase family metal-dependent hydrolase